MDASFILHFSQIRMSDVPRVGGKNASLGELFVALKPKGIGVLDGFAITTDAYWRLLAENGLREKLEQIFAGLDAENLEQLAAAGHDARTRILETPVPTDLRASIAQAYHDLVQRVGRETGLAVRSSASAEDLPEASFAGAAETFLNIRGDQDCHAHRRGGTAKAVSGATGKNGESRLNQRGWGTISTGQLALRTTS